jgi:hypothetical protein
MTMIPEGIAFQRNLTDEALAVLTTKRGKARLADVLGTERAITDIHLRHIAALEKQIRILEETNASSANSLCMTRELLERYEDEYLEQPH